ncbi:hypothetical protein HCZ30_12995 [Marivivens donghaensis]|uniref:Oxetanocin A resistance protein n=1 Tax=Marivivens donghaensis TaxID=1699413 RepID=A0ABX0W0Y3_9RHOB|nr:hypothetical protein [Marivivens donghaensis]NIY73345.1 hypothetical protein [Marivivens donghaensis]
MSLPDLTSDCMNCAALCCVSLVLDKGKMFAIDKPAGKPCPNLGGHLCTIHESLENEGFKGCTLYDCAGAGQRVTQERFNGESWRDAPELLPAMMRDFANLRPLHERLTMLVAAEKYSLTPELEERRQQLIRKTSRIWSDSPTAKEAFDAFIRDLRTHAGS